MSKSYVEVVTPAMRIYAMQETIGRLHRIIADFQKQITVLQAQIRELEEAEQ